MLSLWKTRRGADTVAGLHARIVAASRRPDLYGEGGLPDSVEGRFESLVLHATLVLRRLRRLPPPADDLSQDLVDAVFAHLEIALREMGVGDFGVPKRMKKLGQAFYDRAARYDPLITAGDRDGLAAMIAARLDMPAVALAGTAAFVLASERELSGADLDAVLAGPPFADAAGAVS